MSIDTLREAVPGLKVYIHMGDAPMLTDGDKNAFRFFFNQDRVWKPADVLLTHGDEIPVGNATLRVIHTPGHSKGSMCLECGDHLFTGDTLFPGACGRVDLPSSDPREMRKSLLKLSKLPEDTQIFAGHSYGGKCSSFIGYERTHNPFMRNAIKDEKVLD
jgi:glyoxylase-like metal-dependent hydrolase (beta-lactamase superfamily II)